jgi:hypothetical protein
MNDLKVETGEVTDILPTTARITGYILSGGDGIKKYGHCYGKIPDPKISGTKTQFTLTIGTGRYTSFLQNLEPGTQYYVKSYISRDNITEYGAEINFTTVAANKPELITTVVSAISQNGAISGGTITNDGGSPITERGVCWNISPDPDISDSRTIDGTGPGAFSSILRGLTPNTTYYLRAYATNRGGTSYGNELIFITAP